MADKILNTRIKLKYDSLANWKQNNPVLLAGEVAVAFVPTGENTETVNSIVAPQIVFKVGDGTSTFNTLPFASGLAADVYSWAKAATKPTYNATEVGADATGSATKALTDAKAYTDQEIGKISSEIETDTNTIFRLSLSDHTLKLQSQEKGSTTWKDVTVVTLPDAQYTLETGSANGTVSFNGIDVAVKGLGSAAYTQSNAYATSAQGTKADSAVQTITIGSKTFTKSSGTATLSAADARTALELSAAAQRGVLTSVSESNSLPTGTAVKAYVDTAINAVKQFEYEVVASLPTASANTMGKIYLVSHTHATQDTYDEYITLKSSDTYKWEKIGNTDIDLTGYQKKLSGTGSASKTLTSVGENGTLTFSNISITKAQAGLANVDNTSDATKKTNFTGSIANNDTGFVTGGDIYTALQGKQSTITFDGTYNSSTNKAATVKTVTDKIAALDSSTTATSGHALTGITITDGKITAKTEMAVDNTKVTTVTARNGLNGSISNDGTTITIGVSQIATDLLSQGTRTLIFDCGNSSI